MSKARDLVLTSKGQVEIVEFGGEKFEVRSPSFAQRMRFLDALAAGESGKPPNQLSLADQRKEAETIVRALLGVLVDCVYDSSGARVFEPSDVDALMEARGGEPLRSLLRTTKELLDEKAGDLAKKSGETESSSLPA